MSVPVEQAAPVPELTPTIPEPQFTVVRAAPVEHAAAPTMVFGLDVAEPSGRDVFTIALTAMVHIDAPRRGYDPETRARLIELFGDPARGGTATSLLWARVDALVPSFAGATQFELQIPCTYDLEVAVGKYFHAVRDGEVPVSLHFNGTVFYRGDDGELQATLIPWSTVSDFKLPVSAWRTMIDAHFPGATWMRVEEPTLERLQAWRVERGLPTFSDAVASLLEADDAR